MIYINLLLVSLIVIYIVDLSGFTDTVLNVASKLRGRRYISLKPFTCSLCMVWWTGLVCSLSWGQVSIPVIAYIALLSLFSFPMGKLLLFLQKSLEKLADYLIGKLYE